MYTVGRAVQYTQQKGKRTTLMMGIVEDNKHLARHFCKIRGRGWIAEERIVTVSIAQLRRRALDYVSKYILWMSRAFWHPFAQKWAQFAAKKAFELFAEIEKAKAVPRSLNRTGSFSISMGPDGPVSKWS
jgi:hypothetical protein